MNGGRNEEGVAILVKSSLRIPLFNLTSVEESETSAAANDEMTVGADYRLLPRFLNDPK